MDLETARKRLAAATQGHCDKCKAGELTSCRYCICHEERAKAAIQLKEHAPATLAAYILAVEALKAEKKARLATGWRSTCDKQVHGDSHIQCGKCFICLERKALAAWEAL